MRYVAAPALHSAADTHPPRLGPQGRLGVLECRLDGGLQQVVRSVAVACGRASGAALGGRPHTTAACRAQCAGAHARTGMCTRPRPRAHPLNAPPLPALRLPCAAPVLVSVTMKSVKRSTWPDALSTTWCVVAACVCALCVHVARSCCVCVVFSKVWSRARPGTGAADGHIEAAPRCEVTPTRPHSHTCGVTAGHSTSSMFSSKMKCCRHACRCGFDLMCVLSCYCVTCTDVRDDG
jgi:hypothetical protein